MKAHKRILHARARGYTVGGYENGSGWFVDGVAPGARHFRCPLLRQWPVPIQRGGPAGQVVVIEASPDLRTWTPLQTNTLGAGPLSFSDPQPAVLPSRFYRLRSGQ